MRRTRLLLDANVLVDAQLRDLFLRLAEAGVAEVRWSERILGELRRALVGRLRMDPAKADHLLDVLGSVFPEALVSHDEALLSPSGSEVPDPDDRHVLASAVIGECDLLVTHNLDDFPDDAVDRYDILVVSPDDALVLSFMEAPAQVVACVERQRSALRQPAVSMEDFLRRLAGPAPTFTLQVGAALGLEPYARIVQDVATAEDPRSPHGTVDRLLDAVRDRSGSVVAELIDQRLATDLTGLAAPTPGQVIDALVDHLGDAVDGEGWGFATAVRLAGPDEELVKYVRGGSRVVIAHEPQLATGHVFRLRHEPGGWVVVAIDEPDPALEQA